MRHYFHRPNPHRHDTFLAHTHTHTLKHTHTHTRTHTRSHPFIDPPFELCSLHITLGNTLDHHDQTTPTVFPYPAQASYKTIYKVSASKNPTQNHSPASTSANATTTCKSALHLPVEIV